MATVIITRPQPAMAKAAAVYTKAGFQVFESPCFDITTNTSVKPEWLMMETEVMVVLSVHALHHALLIEPDFTAAPDTRVIAVGPAVARAWQQHFNQEIEYHPLQNSEGVVALLEQRHPQSIKILTTGDGRDVITSYCMSKQISYTQINTYDRVHLPVSVEALTKLCQNDASHPVILTATSAGILEHFMSELDEELLQQVKRNPLVVGAQRIAESASATGFTEIYQADSPSDEAMSKAVKQLN